MAKRRSNKKSTVLPIIVILLIMAAAYAANRFGLFDTVLNKESSVISETSDLSVHFINVGQGDCSLILSEDTAILIDTGEKENGEMICNYLKDNNVPDIDCLFLSHPHSDHMGAASYIIDNADVKQIVIPKVSDDMTPTTKFYENFLKSVQAKGLKITAAKPGIKIDAGAGELEVISPVKDYNDMNNYSASAILTHGNNTFLFTGDIEKKAEKDILKEGELKDIDVLKVPHHGSSSSCSDNFLETVLPDYAVIMCDGHSYGHPHEETITKLSEYTDKIYRTDMDGTIIMNSNENDIMVDTEK